MSIHESLSNHATLSALQPLFKIEPFAALGSTSVSEPFSARGPLSEVQIIQRLETHDFEVCVFVCVLYCAFVCVCV